MTGKWKWFFTVIFPILAYVLTTATALPAIKQWLGSETIWTQLLVQSPVALLFVIYQLFPVRKQYNKFVKFEKSRQEILEEIHKSRLARVLGKQLAEEIRVSIMVLGRRRPNLREPWKNNPSRKRISIRRCFTMEHKSKNLIGELDTKLKFTMRQGACGIACANLRPAYIDLRNGHIPGMLNLTAEQLASTREMKAILSVPIRKKRDGELIPEPLGSINIDCDSDDFPELIASNPKKRKQILRECKALAELCSNLF